MPKPRPRPWGRQTGFSVSVPSHIFGQGSIPQSLSFSLWDKSCRMSLGSQPCKACSGGAWHGALRKQNGSLRGQQCEDTRRPPDWIRHVLSCSELGPCGVDKLER